MQLSRILSVITMVISAAWIGSEISTAYPWEAVLVWAVAFVSWVVSEYRCYMTAVTDRALVDNLSDHDVRLGQRLVDAFPRRIQRFLDEHSFGLPFDGEEVAPLHSFSGTWKGVDSEFVEGKLQSKAEAVVTANDAFLEKLALSVGVAVNYPPTWYSVPTRQERAKDLFEPRTDNAINELHRLSKLLLDAFEDFKREYRSRTDGRKAG